MKRFVAAPTWADYVIPPFGSLSVTSDADVDDYIWGIVGITVVSSLSSKSGVVDKPLMVKGTNGL